MNAHATTAPERVRIAATMTLVVHAVRSACALLLLAPLMLELAPQLTQGVFSARLGSVELAILLEVVARSGRRLVLWAFGCGAGYVLLAPLLALAWLFALAREEPIAASFARATSAYPPALGLAGCAIAAWSAAPFAAVLLLQPDVASALPHSVAVERVLTILCAAAVALWGLVISTVHDLARGRLTAGARFGAALRFGLGRISTALLVRHAVFAAAIGAVTAAAELVGRVPLAAPVVVLLAVQQLLLLGTTLLRAGWLATALNACEPAGRTHA